MTTTNRQRPLAIRLAVHGALTVTLLIGVENMAVAHGPNMHAALHAEPAPGNTDRGVALGEAAVAKSPQDAALRATLGQAYLRAGRFEAATSMLHDALALGEGSGRTMLGLALAQIACGQNRAALGTLDRGAAAIEPAELGLALALAGDTQHGVAVLTDGVRDGLATPKLRENLAYAYALAGRWADAKLTAGFDLSPDQVDARLQQWAQWMQSGGERVRIARLLNAPVTAGQGVPVALELNQADAPAETAPAPEPATVKPDASGELPAITATLAVAIVEPVTPAPVAAASFLPAAPWPPALHRAVHSRRAITNFDHVVQLGAFSSALGAERAKLILAKRNPQLRGHGFLITQAKVNGRVYWRVATMGFDGETASVACAGLKHHGAACFAYALHPAPHRQAMALADTANRRR